MKHFIITALCSVFLHTGFAQDSVQQYLGILTLTPHYQTDSNWTSDDYLVVTEHFNRLQKMAADGRLLLAGRVQLPSDHPDMIGIVIIHATTEALANAIMFEDPAVVSGIMQAKVLPFAVAVAGDLKK